jgi:hypothetical protein
LEQGGWMGCSWGGEWGGEAGVPAERLVGAVLQLAAAARIMILWLPAAAGEVRALEPAEPRPAAPRWSDHGAASKGPTALATVGNG